MDSLAQLPSDSSNDVDQVTKIQLDSVLRKGPTPIGKQYIDRLLLVIVCVYVLTENLRCLNECRLGAPGPGLSFA